MLFGFCFVIFWGGVFVRLFFDGKLVSKPLVGFPFGAIL